MSIITNDYLFRLFATISLFFFVNFFFSFELTKKKKNMY